MRASLLALAACGGTALQPTPPTADTYGPLDIGADYLTYRKLTDAPFQSLDHGSRWVDVYVNDLGAAAYLSGAAIPVGTIIVKTSLQNVNDAPSATPGPIFVMQKRAPGYAPAHDDWYYAIHWADPPPDQRAKFGGPFYWRGSSPRVAYCWSCHDSYDRKLGGLISSSILKR